MIEKLKTGMVREKVFGVLCLTVIALASMVKMDEPENVIAGSAGTRKPEPPKE